MSMITSSKRPKDSIPTSSTADIAFLLLIFFLVTTVFPKDMGLALVLPETAGEVSPDNVLHLIVEASGNVGVRRGASLQTQTVRPDGIAQVWRDGVAANPRLIALVRTNPDAAYGRMIDVLDQLRSAGATRVSLEMNEN